MKKIIRRISRDSDVRMIQELSSISRYKDNYYKSVTEIRGKWTQWEIRKYNENDVEILGLYVLENTVVKITILKIWLSKN